MKKKKKCCQKIAILLVFQFDQSSPVQPVSEIQKYQKISKKHFFSKHKKKKFSWKKILSS